MPPLPNIANMLKVFLEGFVDGEDVYNWGNVLHFEYTGTAPTNLTCATIAGDIATAWSSHMSAEQPSPSTLTKVTVTDLTSPTSGEGEALVSVSGTRGDDSIPANAAVLISYVPTYRYRGGHPRHYLFAGGNADLEGAAKWSTAFTAECLSHWQAFVSACEAITVSGTALSTLASIRYYGKFLPNGGPPRYLLTTPIVQPLTISAAVAAQEIASQRRRVGRRKR